MFDPDVAVRSCWVLKTRRDMEKWSYNLPNNYDAMVCSREQRSIKQRKDVNREHHVNLLEECCVLPYLETPWQWYFTTTAKICQYLQHLPQVIAKCLSIVNEQNCCIISEYFAVPFGPSFNNHIGRGQSTDRAPEAQRVVVKGASRKCR